MRLHPTLLVLGLLSLVAIAGCGDDDVSSGSGSDGAPTAAQLGGKTFVSSSVTGHELVEGSEVELMFTTGDLSAQAGCNQLGGGYSLQSNTDGTTLVIDGEMRSTLMGCPPDLSAQDVWLTEFLTSKPTIALDGDDLELTSDDVSIELSAGKKAGASSSGDLAGTTWNLDTINQGSSSSAVPAGVKSPTLGFDAAGKRTTVFTGCNQGNADVTITDAAMTFGPMALTQMACPGAADQVQASVVAVLDGRTDYTVKGNELTITKGDRGLIYVPG